MHSMFNYLRVVNDHHVNTVRVRAYYTNDVGHCVECTCSCACTGISNFQFKPEDILASGPTVISGILANTLLDFGEILYEEIPEFISINKVNKKDMISTVSFVETVEQLPQNSGKALYTVPGRRAYYFAYSLLRLACPTLELEKVHLKVLGLKNMDPGLLLKTPLPKELFGSQLMKPREYEEVWPENEVNKIYMSVHSVSVSFADLRFEVSSSVQPNLQRRLADNRTNTTTVVETLHTRLQTIIWIEGF